MSVKLYERKPGGRNFVPLNFESTTFPDGTNQAWHFEREINEEYTYLVTWEYENLAEFFLLASIDVLLHAHSVTYELHIPYMPFARQDKKISSDSTFALHAFIQSLQSLQAVTQVVTLDMHSNNFDSHPLKILSLSPVEEIEVARRIVKPDVILFPDGGAMSRYEHMFKDFPYAYASKNRDSDGNLGEMYLVGGHPSMRDKTVLMIDDICDGGATFIKAAELAYSMGVKAAHLYVTHGLFTRGLDVLKEAGIKSVHTRKGVIYV